MRVRRISILIGREVLIIASIALMAQWQYFFKVIDQTLNFNKTFSSENFQAKGKNVSLFYHNNKLWYITEKSSERKLGTKFFLHVYPRSKMDLVAGRQLYGYDLLDSCFDLGFDSLPEITGKSKFHFAVINLPAYRIQNVLTGQYNNEGKIWEANFTPSKLLTFNEYRKIFSPFNLKAEANNFAVYICDNNIYYLNRNPSIADKNDPFFLHIYPDNINDIVLEQRQSGFDNLDFNYANCRLVLPESSGMMHYLIASHELPNYRLKHIETGQYNATGRTWQLNLDGKE